MKRLIAVCVAVAAVVLIVWLAQRAIRGPMPVEEISEIERAREVTLYFGSEDAASLVPEYRRVRSVETVSGNLRVVIEALISGPQGQGVATLPSSVRLLGVYVRDRTAYIDFSQEIVDDFVGGTAAEYMLVSSVVQTICGNFHNLEAVAILVEGQELDTIGGHLLIRQPLRPEDWR